MDVQFLKEKLLDEAILARKNAEDKYFQEYSYTNSLKNSDVIT